LDLSESEFSKQYFSRIFWLPKQLEIPWPPRFIYWGKNSKRSFTVALSWSFIQCSGWNHSSSTWKSFSFAVPWS
jgi:hypothetical protein